MRHYYDRAIRGVLKPARYPDRIFNLRRRRNDDRALLWIFVFPRELRLHSLARGEGIYDVVRSLTERASVVEGPWRGYEKSAAAQIVTDFKDYVKVERGLQL